jgi:hypothetical protein
MAKKCIPGVICIENMTLFICIVLAIFVWYLSMQVSDLKGQHDHQTSSSSVILTPTFASQEIPTNDIRGDVGRCGPGGRTIGDPLTNPYVPPIRCDAGSLTTPAIAVPALAGRVPINVPTQRYNLEYSQMGILTKQGGSGNPDIMPLMGRQVLTSRQKWQYYTVSGGGPGGHLQSKLPVRVKGRSCSGEYGCDEIYNGDEVVVEGFQDRFVATIYESGLFSYLPY